MDIDIDDRGGLRRLRLSGELTIYAAAQVQSAMMAAWAGAAEFEIELAGVTEIDTAGLQLLMAAKRDANAAGVPLRLTGHSAPVVELLDLFDLAGWFGDPMLLPAREERTTAC
ncbi:STAS domain-containing protein [Pelomonas sp. P7]|uniref:STAS domain-containing protein n=1 Tax=Pelomonas caseinilytica TaxID=2906763 RepID=A0ABS8XK43_9BURK|nr:STAS domain-containing protein [Pelomonas sp. P7]MCE4538934.1 STAS domain-containing protein [Pelomonas sp. P7]